MTGGVQAENLTIEPDTRTVPLSGQSNFRDIGGYQTTDGRTVKRGILYRSGELHKLSDKDVDSIEALGIRTVINFLTSEEIEARGGDRLPRGY
jgi:protein-tyrosine phosphatase